MFNILTTTLLHRPYVFVFFAAFLVISLLNRGPARTLLFFVCGFFVAWISEFSSIRNGFPYGMYHYLYNALEGEWIWGGVPVWDSLSYVFLAYAAYECGQYFFSPLPGPLPRDGGEGWVRGWKVIITSLLMVLLDIVVDPLAVQGDRWFLGRIFYYPDGGAYFGVPLSNFGGWLLVALTIFTLYRWGEKALQSPPPLKATWLGPAFYAGIAAFNLGITFWIGEITLGLVGLALHMTAFTIGMKLRQSALPSSRPR